MTQILPDDVGRGFSTRAIHAGQRPDPTTGTIMPPIHQTSTYAQEALGVHKGYEYARSKNPTREALERNVANLEGAKHGFAFSSGMGCFDTLMKLFRAGDHLVIGSNVYGGTFRLVDKIIQHYGIAISWVDTRDPQKIEDAIRPNTKGLILETPTNPLMHLTDLAAASAIAKKAGALTIVDNTFASPFFQNPLALGADIVWHSSTKYLNGHSDLLGGVAVMNDDALAARVQFAQNSGGAVPGPMDAWLTLRGTKTLALRMRAHDANGRAVAQWLADRMGAERVFFPGLPSHPQHELAKRQMRGFGGMVSCETGSRENADRIVRRFRLFTLAESLGGVESLVCQPAGMTHASIEPARRLEIGITDGLLRLSVGVEDIEDLLEDLEQAFQGI
ncbi:MAG: aminotransferase class I/II-fold pyridoxal phosphate-dependent enzyme [Gemmatimonadota bacterium]|jgi:cystathionine gamma-lyase|nr:aminotransferase class I/II-fold pyridoxal phosphate-dependent enzyme [Gemmatimonadota bacterium]MDQ8150867.1 aminotransferase class I/II-fold pyridoxal phosphate-dependent enzyme [Gemmatimonadota bacterium]MDQ8152549.1 aminotransferase class I/II-fold pyridoxal phosphate-dependent enzyme [Gemmatimonadota bacterium]MDQ8170781.1 aminotransferase class I/II-fold pyridoxal phosphate-dependent enzyme [Gemmatimonadota bacterium]MDQ8175425.1 aminotransferase class I/II-fold pyridoxal phosphate-dep